MTLQRKDTPIPPEMTARLPALASLSAELLSHIITHPAGQALVRAAWNAASIWPVKVERTYRFGPPAELADAAGLPITGCILRMTPIRLPGKPSFARTTWRAGHLLYCPWCGTGADRHAVVQRPAAIARPDRAGRRPPGYLRSIAQSRPRLVPMAGLAAVGRIRRSRNPTTLLASLWKAPTTLSDYAGLCPANPTYQADLRFITPARATCP